MVAWIKEIVSILPESYYNIVIYSCLTGLRPSEACQSVCLIQSDFLNYYNKDKSILEHFRYPEIFIRRTKNAYISIITDFLLNVARNCNKVNYSSLKSLIRRKGIGMNMAYCRKVFATHLRDRGIEHETIDLLQGRIPNSVFLRHYYRPNFAYGKIQDSINSLYHTLVE